MIRFGLIGCGKIAERHAKLLTGNHVAGAKLGAVCDANPERALAFGAAYGGESFKSISAMMDSANIDAVTVLTPSGCHGQNVMELA